MILEVLLRDSVKPKLKRAGFEACLLANNLKLGAQRLNLETSS